MEKKNPLKKKPGNKVTKDKKVAKKAPTTRAGRIVRGPLFWIVVAILGVTIFRTDFKRRKPLYRDRYLTGA